MQSHNQNTICVVLQLYIPSFKVPLLSEVQQNNQNTTKWSKHIQIIYDIVFIYLHISLQFFTHCIKCLDYNIVSLVLKKFCYCIHIYKLQTQFNNYKHMYFINYLVVFQFWFNHKIGYIILWLYNLNILIDFRKNYCKLASWLNKGSFGTKMVF